MAVLLLLRSVIMKETATLASFDILQWGREWSKKLSPPAFTTSSIASSMAVFSRWWRSIPCELWRQSGCAFIDLFSFHNPGEAVQKVSRPDPKEVCNAEHNKIYNLKNLFAICFNIHNLSPPTDLNQLASYICSLGNWTSRVSLVQSSHANECSAVKFFQK